ncbi:hypothetical protein V8C42DRAFT_344288 [Trichoderma barbatum]
MARRRNTRSRSIDSPDPAYAALEAQRQALGLQKKRNEDVKAVVAESDAALAELRAKATAWHEDLQRQRAERRVQCLTEIIKMSERREAIEVKMASIVAKAHARMEELEAMMMAGYAGREKDAAAALEKVTGHRHGS